MIDNNTRFLGIDSTKVNLIEKKDEQNNAVSAYFTAEEMAKAVSGLQGTQYVYVAANGTGVENAAELQAAYNEAITKVKTSTVLSDNIIDIAFGFPQNIGNGANTWFSGLGFPKPLISLGVQNVEVVSNQFTGIIEINVTFIDTNFFQFTYSGNNLSNVTSFKYSLTEIQRATVIAAPYYYNFATNFVMDAEYVDLVSLDGNRSIILSGEGTISVTANDVFIKGVDVQTKNFTIADNLNLLKVENCAGGNNSFGSGVTVSGTFTDCVGAGYSFGGGAGGTASGTFTDCVGAGYSFGGGAGGTASGIFINCKGAGYSFSGGGGTASGIFINCEENSVDGRSFGQFGIASGTFNNCNGKVQAFGGNGEASGIFNNCQAGYYAFGGLPGGTLTGKLYYCRLISPTATFKTISGGGITRLCIDGNNVENNQG